MNVSIVIPNYNGEGLLEKNLPLVFDAASFYKQQTKQDIEVIVIDDASTDGSQKILDEYKQKNHQAEIPFVVEIKKENTGFSPTVNIGVKKATGVIVVLLNTDVAPTQDFLLPLIPHFEDKNVFAVGIMDKSIEQGKEVLRGRGIGTWERGLLVHSAGKLDKTNSLWVSGGSGAFSRKKWIEIGGLDELFAPFYWEDIDISYRALKSGLLVLFENKSVVVHEHERGAIKTKYSSSDIKKIAYRNQLIFVWKNADETMLWYHLVWLPYHFIKAIVRKDTNFFSAFFSTLRLLSAIRNERKKVQRHFIYSDYDIIAKYRE